MQRFWSQLAVQLGRRAGLVSVLGLLVTLALGFGITKLEFATGQDSYLNAGDQVYKDNVAYQDLFGGQAMLSVITMNEGHRVEELFTQSGVEQFTRISQDLHQKAGIHGVITPLTALEFDHRLVDNDAHDVQTSIAGKALLGAIAGAPDPASAKARQDDAIVTLGRVNAIPPDQRVLTNPEWVKFLLYDNQDPPQIRPALRPFFPNPTNALVLVRLLGNESIDAEGAASERTVAILDEMQFPDATIVSTGAPVLLKDLNDYLRGGMLTLGAVAVAIMVIILLLLFDVRWRLLPLAVILVGVVWAFGLAGYLGIPLTIVTIAGLPVMLGVGIDYAIQMHARVEEEVVVDRSHAPIQETARNLCPALLVVTFDAIFAFAALRFAKVPMIRQFGLLLAVGIAAICLCSIIMPLAVLGMREFRSPTRRSDFREGALGRLTVKLGSIPDRFGVVLAVASILIFAGGIIVEDKLVIQTDPVKWVDQSSEVIQDLHVVEEQIGGSSELGVFVESADGLFNDTSVTFQHEFYREQMATYAPSGQIVFGTGIVPTISDLLVVPGAADAVPTAETVKAAYDVAPPDIQAATTAAGGDAMNIVFLTGPGSLESRQPMVNEMRDNSDPPPGIKITPSGLAVVGVGLLENLEANRILLTYLSIAFVFLFLSVRLRSVIRSLLSLVPVLIAVGTASLVAWAASLELSPMTAVGGPLVVAACTEFTSLILLRFVEERQRGLEPREAVDVAASRTGRAFIVSGLTAIAGVAVLSLSSLPLLRDFGRIVAMNVGVALLSALVVLPPMLVWADRRNLVSRGMVKPEKKIEPFLETPYEPDLGGSTA